MKKLVIISPFFLTMKRGIEQFTFNISNQIIKNSSFEVIIYTWACKNPVIWPKFEGRIKIRKVPYLIYYPKYLILLLYKLWLLIDRPEKKILNFLWYGERYYYR